MILSRRHRFIFIKGMKVAGTSIEMALAGLCGPDDIVTPISQVDELARLTLGGRAQNYSIDRAAEADYLARLQAAEPAQWGSVVQPAKVYFNHMALRAVMLRLGDISAFRVVCCERSPYAKVISWANMQLSYDAYRSGGTMQGDVAALAQAVDRGFANGGIRNARNIDLYRGMDGKVAAQPMRYERLAEDFAAFVRSLGVTRIPSLPHAKKGLMSDSLDPGAVLRPDQIARINILFAEEFETFGYPML